MEKNRYPLKTKKEKYKKSWYSLKLRTFAIWESLILICPESRIFDILNLVNMEAASAPKASMATVAQTTVISAVDLRNQCLSIRQKDEASCAAAY